MTEPLTVIAIDPGDVHQGVATFEVDKGDVRLVGAVELAGHADLFEFVEKRRIDVLVLEEYRLYPFQARVQGYSDFPTAQAIGVLKYIAGQRRTPVVMQKAMVKKQARTIAVAQGIPMTTRSLGSGKGAYKGPDFDNHWLKREFGGKASQHIRDAVAHGFFWAWTSPDSPARLGR